MTTKTAIGCVRIRDGTGDSLRVRTGVERLLSGAELRADGMPPAAIVVVRSLADPLPGRLDPRGDALRPSRGWERAVCAALGELARGAARPAREPVGAGARAVRFEDRAELLACVALDACDGTLPSRWWWRALKVTGPNALVRAWTDAPEAVPAALARLAAGGRAGAVVASVPADAAAIIARAMARSHGAELVAAAALGTAPGGAAAVARAPARARTRGYAATGAATADPPWRPYAPEADGVALAPEQAVLLGLGLALRRAAPVVRTARFHTAVVAWRRAPCAEPSPLNPATRPAPLVRPRSRAASAARARAAGGGSAVRNPLRAGPAAPAAGTPARAVSANEPTPAAADAPAHGAGLPVTGTPTRLGGLFHLVDVGILLGLYGDFTRPERPGIALDVWDFVTLVGQRLLGRAPRDPVWALLAELAGRRDQPPGRGFRPPRAWRVPPAWLAPLPSRGAWRHVPEDGRVVILHPRGFAVVDAPRAELDRELRRYADPPVRAVAPRTARGRTTALDRWVEHVAAYVRARLAVALGVRARVAPRLALCRPARVHVTDLRVDVVSDLADLPIEVRLAGLDRDPGHVPAAGRALYFHFE